MGAQERVDRRRAQILAAASRVFARQGFHRTTVRQVASEAGIADGTIYLYFDSKQELLLRCSASWAGSGSGRPTSRSWPAPTHAPS